MESGWFWLILVIFVVALDSYFTGINRNRKIERWAYDHSLVYAGKVAGKYRIWSRPDQRPWSLEIGVDEGELGLPVWKTKAISIPNGKLIIRERLPEDSKFFDPYVRKVEVGSPLLQQHYTTMVSDIELAPQVITPPIEQVLLDLGKYPVEIRVDQEGMKMSHSRWEGNILDSAASLMKLGPRFVEAWMQYF